MESAEEPVQLWTLQGEGVDLAKSALDPKRSPYAPQPNYFPARSVLKTIRRIPDDQFAWFSRCPPSYTTTGIQRLVLYKIPRPRIHTVIDGAVWDPLINEQNALPEENLRAIVKRAIVQHWEIADENAQPIVLCPIEDDLKVGEWTFPYELGHIIRKNGEPEFRAM